MRILPNRVVLFVIRAAAIAGQPLQGDRRLGSVCRHVVRRVRLGAFDDQMSGRHYGRHLVTGDTMIVPEIRFSKVLDRDVSAVYIMATFRQRRSVSLYAKIDVRLLKTHTKNKKKYSLTLCHWILGFCVPSASCASQCISTDSLIFRWYIFSGSTVNVGGFLTNTSI